MRTILTGVFLLLSTVTALATSYSVQGGFLFYEPSNSFGYWTPRMLELRIPPNGIHQIPLIFHSANLSVTCTPVCGVGDSFSLNLSMTGFVDRNYGGLWSGTIDLVTKPVELLAQTGVVIPKFVLTGDLSGCYFGVGCIQISPDLHGYPMTVQYKLLNGKVQILSMSFAIPEPSTLMLLGTGLFGIGFFANQRRSVGLKPKL